MLWHFCSPHPKKPSIFLVDINLSKFSSEFEVKILSKLAYSKFTQSVIRSPNFQISGVETERTFKKIFFEK